MNPFSFSGKVFEKAGVNVSVIHGRLGAEAIRQLSSRGKKLKGENLPFLSLVSVQSFILLTL